MSTTDPDRGSSFVYTLVAGQGDSDNAAFNISGANLIATNSFDFETKSSYTLRVRSTDQGGLFTERAFAIAVTDANEAPTDMDLSPKSIAENAGSNSIVGTVNATDQDAISSFAYTLVAGSGDADNAAFNLSGSDLRATNGFDFETKSSYTIRLRATDQGGLFTERMFTVSVTNVNESPSLRITSMVTTVPESNTAGLDVADVAISDDALGVNSISLSGPDAAKFVVSNGKLKLNPGSLDFETKPILRVTVSVDDPAVGTSPDQSIDFVLNVTDVNEAPTLVFTNVVSTVSEMNTTGLDAASVAVADDALGTNSISLTGPDAALFEIASGKLKLKPSALGF